MARVFDPGSIPGRSLPWSAPTAHETDAPSRASVVGKGRCRARYRRVLTMTTVCTCNPDVNWTRFIVERVSDYAGESQRLHSYYAVW